MKVAVIGSRSFNSYSFLADKLAGFSISCVVSGGARGADSLGARYALECGLPLQVFVPNYSRFGRSAPLVRNRSVVGCVQLVVAFWDGRSPGTAHALGLARRLGLPCRVFWPV